MEEMESYNETMSSSSYDDDTTVAGYELDHIKWDGITLLCINVVLLVIVHDLSQI